MSAAIRDINHRLFGGYAELLRKPHTARFAIGSVIASMPFPMVGMTITISVQHYYGSYFLAGMLTAIQAIALSVASPLLGKLVDKFGQREIAIPTVIVWVVAAMLLITAITSQAPIWVLYAITPFLAAIPPWGAMSRGRWTYILKGDRVQTDRALSLSGVFDECMWVIGNPLASILAVISGILAFSFTGLCVVIGAIMVLSEMSTEPPSQTQHARQSGITRKQYRDQEATKAAILQGGKKQKSIWGPGLIAICVTWFGLGAFQSAAAISIIAFTREHNAEQMTGFVFACFSFSSLLGAVVYGCQELADTTVEAFLCVPDRRQSWHWLLPVRKAHLGNHDYLSAYRCVPGSHVDQRKSADLAPGLSCALYRGCVMDGCHEFDRRFRRFRHSRAIH